MGYGRVRNGFLQLGCDLSIPDVAMRLQSFRSLIVEMRASFLDNETVFDAGVMKKRSRDFSDYWGIT
jgi:hypothetical protein